MAAFAMTVRDDLHNIVDQLTEDELEDARELLNTLHLQEEAGQVFAHAREPDIEAWHRAAIREALEYADRPDPEWVTHDDMAAWLKSWGTDHELPPPLAKRRE